MFLTTRAFVFSGKPKPDPLFTRRGDLNQSKPTSLSSLWQETNKGLDELTRTSHVQSSNAASRTTITTSVGQPVNEVTVKSVGAGSQINGSARYVSQAQILK